MPTVSIYNVNGQQVTTDATPTTIVSLPINDDCSMRVEVSTIARRPSNDNAKTWEQLFLADKTGGGTPSIKGSLTDIISPVGDLGATTWAVQNDVDSTHVLVQVKGQAGATINWGTEAWVMYILED